MKKCNQNERSASHRTQRKTLTIDVSLKRLPQMCFKTDFKYLWPRNANGLSWRTGSRAPAISSTTSWMSLAKGSSDRLSLPASLMECTGDGKPQLALGCCERASTNMTWTMSKKWIIMVKSRERKVFKFAGKKSNSEKYSRLNIWKILSNYKTPRNTRWTTRMHNGAHNKGEGTPGRKKMKGNWKFKQWASANEWLLRRPLPMSGK